MNDDLIQDKLKTTGTDLPVYDIETQYEQGVGEYSFNHGSMFHAVSFQNISVISLDIHTSSTQRIKVQIWTLKGSYVNRTDNATEYGWDLVFDRKVKGQGVGVPTSLQSEFFKSVEVVNGDEGQSFFVLAPTSPTIGNLIFAEGNDTKTDNVFTDNSHLQITVGIGMPQPSFSKYTTKNQVWSGAVWYNVHEDNFITSPPVEKGRVIITGFSGSNFLHGNLFDVYAQTDLVVTSLDIHTDIQGKALPVKVYTKQGSIRENHTTWDDWREIANTPIAGKGHYGSTPIPSSAFSPVIIMADTVQSFFITLTSANLVCTEASNFYPGALWKQNDHVKIFLGVGTNEYPVNLDPASTFYHEHIGWNGIIHYSLDLKSINMNQNLMYYILINHSVEQSFSTQEYLSFVKNKWEASIVGKGYLAVFNYTKISNFNGDQSPFCDIYTTGIIESECYIMQIIIDIIYNSEDSIDSREALIEEGKRITAYFISHEPTTSINFIGPEHVYLNIICSFSGYFDHIEFTTEDITFLENTITTFLSKEFEKYPETSIMSTSIAYKEIEIMQASSRSLRQRRSTNFIGSLSIGATITGEIYSTISNKTTLIDYEIGDLVLDAFYESEAEFLDYINDDATFQGVKYITYNVPQSSAENADDTVYNTNGFTKTWFIAFVVGLVFIIIPSSIYIEWRMRNKKQKAENDDEEQPLQNGKQKRGSIIYNSPQTAHKKRGFRRGSAVAVPRIEKLRASDNGRNAKSDSEEKETLRKRARRCSLPTNIQVENNDEQRKTSTRRVVDRSDPARPSRRASTGGVPQGIDKKKSSGDITKKHAGLFVTSEATLLNTSRENLEFLADDEEEAIRLVGKACYNAETDSKKATSKDTRRRRASIGTPHPSSHFSQQGLALCEENEDEMHQSDTFKEAPHKSISLGDHEGNNKAKLHTTSTSKLTSCKDIDESVNSYNRSLDGSAIGAGERRKAVSRRVSVCGPMPTFPRQLDESHKKSYSTLGSKSGIDQSIDSRTSNDDKRASRRSSISHVPSFNEGPHKSIALEGSNDSPNNLNKSLDDPAIGAGERRNAAPAPRRASVFSAMPSSSRQLDDKHADPYSTLGSNSGIDHSIGSRTSNNDKRASRRASVSHVPITKNISRQLDDKDSETGRLSD